MEVCARTNDINTRGRQKQVRHALHRGQGGAWYDGMKGQASDTVHGNWEGESMHC